MALKKKSPHKKAVDLDDEDDDEDEDEDLEDEDDDDDEEEEPAPKKKKKAKPIVEDDDDDDEDEEDDDDDADAEEDKPVKKKKAPPAKTKKRPSADEDDEDEESDDEDEEGSEVIDLSNVKGGTFEALPAGIYSAIAEQCEYGKSKSSGAPMLTWRFKLVGGDYEGRVFFDHTVLNHDVGLGRIKKIISILTPDIDLSAFNPKKYADEGDWAGQPCQVRLGIELYNDEKRNRVKDVLPPNEDDEEDGLFSDKKSKGTSDKKSKSKKGR